MKGLVFGGIIVGMLFIVGCVSYGPQADYQVTPMGSLSLSIPDPTVQEDILSIKDGITVSHLTFQNINQPIYVLLVVPESPRSGIILAPGAGVKKEDHQTRAETYAQMGIAMAVLDIRGNGGETTGIPLDLESDFGRYNEGLWPQYYAIVADMIATREYLSSRYQIPIYAMGESNGGRYAAIAAGTDSNFSGYIGISTSGFGLVGNRYSGEARKFLLSIDPDHAIGDISPRPVLILHAPDDSIIPYDDSRALFGHAREPKAFWNLSSGHGLNEGADQEIIMNLLNFNVPE